LDKTFVKMLTKTLYIFPQLSQMNPATIPCSIYWRSLFIQRCWQVLSPTRKKTNYDRRFWFSYILFI